MSERDATLDDGDTNDYPVVWRETVEGITAEIRAEQEGYEHANPRDCDEIGRMVCWHTDYVLGDEQLRGGGRSAVKTVFETARGRTAFRSMLYVERYLRLARGAIVTIPLYLYDHSGISIRAGSPSIYWMDNPTVRTDEYGQGLGWDTSMVGFIYTTRERIVELCGEPQLPTDPVYCPRTWPENGSAGPNWTGEALDWIAKQLADEVALYDRYLRGEVYYWRTADAEGDTIDSCSGYLPDVSVAHDAELDYVKQEARESMLAEVASRREAAEAERVESERAARMDIATVQA